METLVQRPNFAFAIPSYGIALIFLSLYTSQTTLSDARHTIPVELPYLYQFSLFFSARSRILRARSLASARA